MKKYRGFIAGMLTMALVVALCGTAIATTGKVQREIEYRNIKVSLDGKILDLKDAKGNAVEPFMFGGTNYIPARALAEALGLNVSWDSATTTVVLTTPNNSTGTNTVPATGNYSRSNPAPLGTPQQVTVNKGNWSYTATVEITKAYRGQTAWAMIREANMFNKAPSSSREYILAAVKVTVDSVSEDRAVNMNEYDFRAFNSNNAEYATEATVEPSPFDGQAYEGATVEGFVSFVVDTDDPAPKVVYGTDYKGIGGVWFSLVDKAE